MPEEERPTEGKFSHAWPDNKLECSIAEALSLGVGLKEISYASVELAIRLAMQSKQGNLQRAAARLGITDRALQMRRAAGQLEAPIAS